MISGYYSNGKFYYPDYSIYKKRYEDWITGDWGTFSDRFSGILYNRTGVGRYLIW